MEDHRHKKAWRLMPSPQQRQVGYSTPYGWSVGKAESVSMQSQCAFTVHHHRSESMSAGNSLGRVYTHSWLQGCGRHYVCHNVPVEYRRSWSSLAEPADGIQTRVKPGQGENGALNWAFRKQSDKERHCIWNALMDIQYNCVDPDICCSSNLRSLSTVKPGHHCMCMPTTRVLECMAIIYTVPSTSLRCVCTCVPCWVERSMVANGVMGAPYRHRAALWNTCSAGQY